MKPKILIVYYSRNGSTRKMAESIAKKLNADIEGLIDTKSRKGAIGWIGAGKDGTFNITTKLDPINHSPENYDLVIIGTPTWSGSITPAVRSYININKTLLSKTAYFTTNTGTKPGKLVKTMETLTGRKALTFTGFNHRDIREESVYNKIIDNFINKIKKVIKPFSNSGLESRS